MSETQLTNTEAAALSGTTDTDTGLKFVTVNTQPWSNDRYREDYLGNAIAALAGNLRVFAVDGNADAIGVYAGRCSITSVSLAFPTTDPAIDGLTDNDTTYIWIENNGGTAEIDSAIDGTGWPGTAHIKLAEVTMASGVITAILDLRAELIFTT